jgi:hypothetical protein
VTGTEYTPFDVMEKLQRRGPAWIDAAPTTTFLRSVITAKDRGTECGVDFDAATFPIDAKNYVKRPRGG